MLSIANDRRPATNDQRPLLCCRFQFLGGFEYFSDCSLQIKSLLGNVVVFAFHNFPESFHGVGNLDVTSRTASELFGNMERLRQESLDLAGARHAYLLIFAQFVDTQN